MQALQVHIKHLNKNYHTCNDILSILYLYKYKEKIMFKALYNLKKTLIKCLIQAASFIANTYYIMIIKKIIQTSVVTSKLRDV